ncbi:hypothetical protein SAMN05414139_07825 [Burkholderia sp. D7]|jgi:hypothetical protein|nr:hypothetical protein SAMN05414139_07825 [Burkholderia sp. D7]
MTEQKMELQAEQTKVYVERVSAFLAQARAWCTERDLNVSGDSVELNEEHLPKYLAPTLHVSTKDGVTVARLVPRGSAIIGAHGRIDLIGHVTRHAFLFQIGKGPTISMKAIIHGKTTSESSRPMLSGVDGDGWYWMETAIGRAKHVDESLFMDLLTDASDYDFE